MTAPLTQTEKESILTLCLLAAFADGGKSDVERAELKRIADNFPESDVNLAALYHRVLLRQVSTAQTAQALANAEARQLAYEMAVCVCEADDVLNEPEKQFLAELRRELQLNTSKLQVPRCPSPRRGRWVGWRINTTPADARFPLSNSANSSVRSRNRPAVCTETTPAPSAKRLDP